MIDNKKLKELIKLMVENDLTELDLQGGDGEAITLKRGGNTPSVQYVSMPTPNSVPPAATSGSPVTDQAEPAVDDGLDSIKSPMVGTFYKASSPDTAAFVSVGDNIGPDTVACIVEAMKVFNEIKAEISGTIEKILVEDGQAVEFDQPLFLVRPN